MQLESLFWAMTGETEESFRQGRMVEAQVIYVGTAPGSSVRWEKSSHELAETGDMSGHQVHEADNWEDGRRSVRDREELRRKTLSRLMVHGAANSGINTALHDKRPVPDLDK